MAMLMEPEKPGNSTTHTTAAALDGRYCKSFPRSVVERTVWNALRFIGLFIFRVRTNGREHLPRTGGALIVANGHSHFDAMFLAPASRRPIRLVGRCSNGSRLIRVLCRLKVILPIESGPKECLSAVLGGELVCVFVENGFSRIGGQMPLYLEIEEVLQNTDCSVVPVALDRPRFAAKGSRQPLRRTYVKFGSSLPRPANAALALDAVQVLMTAAWFDRKSEMQPLHRSFGHTARRHPFRFAMSDIRTPRLNFLGAFARTIYLGRRLSREWDNVGYIGVLLPPSIAGALVNFAAFFAGKIAVNLNYTASVDSISATLRQCGIERVITSAAFLKNVPLQLPCRMLLLEEIAAKPRTSERLVALLAALFAPMALLERMMGRRRAATMDDTATVISSSGSTGNPKGIVLSHFNIASNIAQLTRVFTLAKGDCFLGTLPFFHSFGFTVTLCLPAILGVGVAYHPTPLDASAVGRLVRDYGITFLLSTPTFLQLYLRGCSSGDFSTLRVVVAGAEKLNNRLAAAFEEKFGICPLEGYGCTECSPVLAVNTPDFHAAGVRSRGAQPGKVGRPLPGISIRIVNLETFEPMERGKAGLLLVQGPNVMQGYLSDPQRTAEVMRDRWYNTGDIAALDSDGFIHLIDRVNRFSKIGGEMIPHTKVEERLHELISANELTFVVAGVEDPKHGERLIVLHRLTVERLNPCLEQLSRDDLPNLWKPKRNDFIYVDSFPLLGSGKLDFGRINITAREHAACRSKAGHGGVAI